MLASKMLGKKSAEVWVASLGSTSVVALDAAGDVGEAPTTVVTARRAAPLRKKRILVVA